MEDNSLLKHLFSTNVEVGIVDQYLKMMAESVVDLRSQLQIQTDDFVAQKLSFDIQQKRLIDMGDKLSEQSNLIQSLIIEQLNEKEISIKQEFEKNLDSIKSLDRKIEKQNDILEKSGKQIDFSNGVWIDPDTGLMWSRISIGQKWVNGECSGNASEMTFVQAEQACQDSWLAGFHDWRLPTIEELKTLQIDEKSGFKHQEHVLYKPTGYDWGEYWSKSRSEEDDNILFINFNDGKWYRSLKDTYTCHVRAVRLYKKSHFNFSSISSFFKNWW